MIISDEQIRRVLEYIQTAGHAGGTFSVQRGAPVPETLLRLAVDTALRAPDLRIERIQQAGYVAEGYLPDAESVAEKLIGRAISDSIR